MFIKYTYVDSVTGIPVTSAPAAHGPADPTVPGLVFGFALESKWPTEKPEFYGTCNDGTSPTIPGILAILTEADYTAARVAEMTTRLNNAKDLKYAALKERRKTSELRGISFTQLGDLIFPAPVSVPAEKDDQDRITGALTSMERWPDKITSISFKANGNVFIEITYPILKLIGFQVAMLSQAAFANEGVHSKAIAAQLTVDAVQFYDFSTGWPN